jgi:subtilase family serine protease
VTVNLASSSAGGTFLDASANPITSVTIAAGASTATFQYRDASVGLPVLTAAATDFTASQEETVTPGSVVYTPAQVRAAYGVNNLALDGSGQTVAIVGAYDDPAIFQALDAFDQQFGPTASGPTYFQQYGAASSFVTVLNQSGQATGLPATDPSGAGAANWELEEALDAEWVHAIAPGAKIVLVEANSQSLSDLLAAVATASAQPGVSVVSMSWGFTEGQMIFAGDEAHYDSVFTTPGVTYLASTGDFGSADGEYPAFSPNVVAVGGTSLYLNADNSYNSETGWGYYSNAVGAFIGSGGGTSLYESEPAYQQGVQTTGYRSTPDVSMVADPSTGAWIADPYNLPGSDPWEVVGGTSLSAPAWSGLVALVNQGRAAAGEGTLNSTTPTDAQQALYGLSSADFNSITSGTNGGYTAAAGYNMVTGLGTPMADRLVPDLVAFRPTGVSSGYVPPTGPSGAAGSSSGTTNALATFNVFNALVVAGPSLARVPNVPRGPETLTTDPPPGAAPVADVSRSLSVAHDTAAKTAAELRGVPRDFGQVNSTAFVVSSAVAAGSSSQTVWAGADIPGPAAASPGSLARLWATDGAALLSGLESIAGRLGLDRADGRLWDDDFLAAPGGGDLGGWLDAVPLTPEAIDAALADLGDGSSDSDD